MIILRVQSQVFLLLFLGVIGFESHGSYTLTIFKRGEQVLGVGMVKLLQDMLEFWKSMFIFIHKSCLSGGEHLTPMLILSH